MYVKLLHNSFDEGAATTWRISTHDQVFTHALQHHQSAAAITLQQLWLILHLLDREGRSSVLKAHTGTVRCVNFSADGKLLITAGDDKTVKVRYTSCTKDNRCLFEIQRILPHVEPHIGTRVCADQPVQYVQKYAKGSQGLRAVTARHLHSCTCTSIVCICSGICEASVCRNCSLHSGVESCICLTNHQCMHHTAAESQPHWCNCCM